MEDDDCICSSFYLSVSLHQINLAVTAVANGKDLRRQRNPMQRMALLETKMELAKEVREGIINEGQERYSGKAEIWRSETEWRQARDQDCLAAYALARIRGPFVHGAFHKNCGLCANEEPPESHLRRMFELEETSCPIHGDYKDSRSKGARP